jgi:hypothetical protein
LDPVGSFGVVLLGVMGYFTAFFIAMKLPVGRSLLESTVDDKMLGRTSMLAAVVGVTANMLVATRTHEQLSDVTVAVFFVPFLHLALIAAIARVLITSDLRRSLDLRVVVLLAAEIAFAMVHNSRMALMEILLCYVVTAASFEYRIKWRYFTIIGIVIAMMVLFITPVFLYVRGFRGDLTWTQRIEATTEAFGNWPEAFSQFLSHRDLQNQMGWFLNYYGRPHNVFERMSLINHVDVIRAGIAGRGEIGFGDLSVAVEKALPRVLAPNKPRGYSQGSWLYYHIGVQKVMGGYATVPLIGSGYAAFGWKGSFFYPFVLGLLYFLVIKKMSGFDLHDNIWAIYLLLRVHDQFVEGSSDSYLVYILRSLPQDFIILWFIKVLAEGRFVFTWRNDES